MNNKQKLHKIKLTQWAARFQKQAIRPFTIGRKNFVLMESDNGAKASAMLYSLVETAKANEINTYQYLELLLTEIPKHMDDNEYSRAVTPQVRQTGNRLSGLAGTAYASLLA